MAADGNGLVGGIGQYEDIWWMAYVRGPEGIIVSTVERIGRRHRQPQDPSAHAGACRGGLRTAGSPLAGVPNAEH